MTVELALLGLTATVSALAGGGAIAWWAQRRWARARAVHQALMHHTAGQDRELNRLRGILDTAADAIVGVGVDGRIHSANPAAERMFGAPAPGQPFTDWLLEPTQDQVRAWLSEPLPEGHSRSDDHLHGLRPDGTAFPLEAVFTAMETPHGRQLVGMLRDVSERHEARDRILHIAHHDELTKLPNRSLLQKWLQDAVGHAHLAAEAGLSRHLAVLFIDLDRFKTVNDTLGHEAGDRLLRDIARYLRDTVRASDHVIRLGGDEFLVIIEHIDTVENIDALAQKIIDAIDGQLRTLEGPVGKVGASIGISVFPQDGERADELIQHADIAMVQAKANGRGRHCRYLPEYSSRITERLDNEQALRLALERDELLVHFQPKVKLRSGHLSGAEALLRWQRPGHGLVMPGAFIALAEDLGLIVPIGEQVIRCTLRQLAAWRRAGLPDLRVAVNVSPEQLRRSDVAGFLQKELAAHGVPANCIEIEITESAMVEQSESVQQQLERLRGLGVRLAIDDFGAGYSSLAQLQRLDVDVIKLDRELVMPLQSGSDAEALCRAIIWMASALGLEVVAEGVETIEQLRVLADVGCDELQGYLFSAPLPAADFEPLLRQPRTAVTDWLGIDETTVLP